VFKAGNRALTDTDKLTLTTAKGHHAEVAEERGDFGEQVAGDKTKGTQCKTGVPARYAFLCPL
jgi:hypothetical protein